MAAGDIARLAGFPRPVGNMYVLVGSIEVDDTPRVFALTDTKSRLIDCQLTDADGIGSANCSLNVNASGTATNGSIKAFGNHQSVDTYRFTAHFT